MFEKSGQAQNYVLLISFPLPTKPLWDKCIFLMVTHSYHLFMQHDSNLDSSGLTRNSFFFLSQLIKT